MADRKPPAKFARRASLVRKVREALEDGRSAIPRESPDYARGAADALDFVLGVESYWLDELAIRLQQKG